MQKAEITLFSHEKITGRLKKIMVLTQRRLLSFYRDKNDVVITFFQAPLLAIIFFLVFQKVLTFYPIKLFAPLHDYTTPNILIFVAVLTAVWFGASKAIMEIPNHLVLYRQESLTFLKPLEFILSSFFALSLIALVQIILFSLTFMALFIVIPAFLQPSEMGFSEDSTLYDKLLLGFWVRLVILLWLTALVSVVTAMLVSVFVKTRSAAVAALTFLMIVQMLLGGSMIQPVKNMNAQTYYASQLIASRWGYEAVIIEFDRSLHFITNKPNFANFSFSGVGSDSLRAIHPSEPKMTEELCKILIEAHKGSIPKNLAVLNSSFKEMDSGNSQSDLSQSIIVQCQKLEEQILMGSIPDVGEAVGVLGYSIIDFNEEKVIIEIDRSLHFDTKVESDSLLEMYPSMIEELCELLLEVHKGNIPKNSGVSQSKSSQSITVQCPSKKSEEQIFMEIVPAISTLGHLIVGFGEREIAMKKIGAILGQPDFAQSRKDLSELESLALDVVLILNPKLRLYRPLNQFHVYSMLLLLIFSGILITLFSFKWQQG